MGIELQKALRSTNKATALLLNGGVGIMPTDTVYGVVARAHDKHAVARLYALKNREHKPGTLIAANVDQLHELSVSSASLDKVTQWWPGPLSIVLAVGDEFAYLHQGVGDIAMRVASSKDLRRVLEKTGPLLTSSANQPGEPGAVMIQQAWDYFHDSVDFYVDGGDLDGRAPSTIIRIKDDGEIEIIRDGAVKLDLIG